MGIINADELAKSYKLSLLKKIKAGDLHDDDLFQISSIRTNPKYFDTNAIDLDEFTKYIALKIGEHTGVEVTPYHDSGDKIATITVNNVPVDIYAEDLKSYLTEYNCYDILPNVATYTDGTMSDITFTYIGKVCHAQGTADGLSFNNVIVSTDSLPDGFIAGKTYKILVNTTSPNLKFGIIPYVNGVAGTASYLNTDTFYKLPNDATGIILRFNVIDGSTVNDDIYVSILNTDTNEGLNTRINTLEVNAETVNMLKNLNQSDILQAIGTFEDNIRPDGGKWTFKNYVCKFVSNGSTSANTFKNVVSSPSVLPDGMVAGRKYKAKIVGTNTTNLYAVILWYKNGVNTSNTTINADTVFIIPDGTNGVYIRYSAKTGEVVNDTVRLEFCEDDAHNTFHEQNNDYGVSVIVPSKIRVCKNIEMNVYHQTMVWHDNPRLCKNIYASGLFTNADYYFRYMPSNVGSFDVGFRFCRYNDSDVTYKGISHIDAVSDTSGSGLTKKCLFIGDSMTDSDKYLQELVSLFENDVMSIDLLGTMDTEDIPNEGRSGWRAYTYCRCANGSDDISGLSYTNPFYNNGHFDFSKYMTDQNYNGVDYVFICLGTNDVAPSRSDHSTDADVVSYWNEMIDSIHDYDGNIKIVLWMPPTGSLMVNYANRIQTDVNLRMHNIIINNWDNMENQNIYLCPVYLNVDPYHDYPYQMKPVSKRNTAFEEAVGTDYVHPSVIGYNKIADVIYSMIKYLGSL